VEDEYFLAQDIVQGLRAEGADVVGPVGAVCDALDLIDATERIDAAVLDLNLRGELAYPVADALTERGVPFVFATGYDQSYIPERYNSVARFEKPVRMADVARRLFATS
jgi:CheY-like chemotaxis protein